MKESHKERRERNSAVKNLLYLAIHCLVAPGWCNLTVNYLNSTTGSTAVFNYNVRRVKWSYTKSF